MGIKGILGLLPGGDEYLRSFRTLDLDEHRVALDAGGLLWGDSDLLAYGCCKIVVVKSWFAETFRLIDLSMKDTDDDIETKPFLRFYRLHGVLVFQLYAACMGCDVTEHASGLPGFGKASFMEVMNDFFGEDGDDLDVKTFATKVELSGKVQKGMNLHDITSYLWRTVHSFNKDAHYYDAKGNICSMEDGEIGTPATPETVSHMKGRCDARSGESFCESDKLALASLKAHELLHNATMDPTSLVGVNLPPGKASVDDCTKAELRAMISVRGGNTTSEAGNDYVKADLVRIVKRFLHLEANRPPLQRFHDRNKHTNGFFLKLKITEKVPAQTAFKQLVASATFQRKFPVLYNMIKFVNEKMEKEVMIDDFDDICTKAPELPGYVIEREFAAVGDSGHSKNLAGSLKRKLAQPRALYHANVFSDDKKHLFIVSKGEASLTKDEKTRKMTARGEKPLPEQYITVLKLRVEPTNIPERGHSLGILTALENSYCFNCTAGQGGCYHTTMALHGQQQFWNSNRPLDKPKTSALCAWKEGGTPDKTLVTAPISELVCQKLPSDPDKMEERIERQAKQPGYYRGGNSSKYDVLTPEKRQRFEDPDYLSPNRPALKKFFAELRRKK